MESYARPRRPCPRVDQFPGLQRRAGRPCRPCSQTQSARCCRRGALRTAIRPGQSKKKSFRLSGSSRSSLHCKAFVFDRKDVFIGSLNLDPRSGDINTEAGLYIESPELAAQVISYMDEGVLPQEQLPGPVGRAQSSLLGHRNRREGRGIRPRPEQHALATHQVAHHSDAARPRPDLNVPDRSSKGRHLSTSQSTAALMIASTPMTAMMTRDQSPAVKLLLWIRSGVFHVLARRVP